jgi:hypothetical protein
MGVVAAIVSGGLALAGGVAGAMGASSAASASAAAQRLQQQNTNFQNEWQKAAQDRNIMRQFQANLERNIQIEKSANKERALSELYLDKSFANQKSTLSKQTQQVNSQFIGTMTGRYVSSTSGSARALLRQNMEAMGANLAAMKVNYNNAYKDIANQQNMRLAQRGSSMAPELSVLLPNTGGIVDNSSAALQTGLIQATLNAASSGFGAYMKYKIPEPTGGGIGNGYPAGAYPSNPTGMYPSTGNMWGMGNGMNNSWNGPTYNFNTSTFGP